MCIFPTCIILSLILVLPPIQIAHDLDYAPFKCSQPVAEREALIRQAETNQYTVRRVEFVGNSYTLDAVLRRRIAALLEEGDVFTRRKLIMSLRNAGKLKTIYPVRLRDVVIRLDKSGKMVDMNICFKEGRRLNGVRSGNPHRAI
jgi:outer membrane protein assembly factor BamA